MIKIIVIQDKERWQFAVISEIFIGFFVFVVKKKLYFSLIIETQSWSRKGIVINNCGLIN